MNGIELQYYQGGIKSNVPKGVVSLESFIKSHANPKDSIVQLIDMIAELSSKGDKKGKVALKEKLPFVTPAIIVDKYRRYANIERFTGICQIDFDGVEKATELRDYLFDAYEQFYCVYVSPSGNGVKGLMRLPICKTVDEFQGYYRAIEEEFEGIDGFDPAPKNAVLPLFVSYDFFIKSRDNPTVWDKKLEKKKDLREQFPLPQKPTSYLKSNEKNKRRALNTVRKAINSILDNGHPQLRSSCLILGTRVGAGYLSMQEAEEEVEYLIRTNSYLQKGIKGYITTANWSIYEGSKTPKSY